MTVEGRIRSASSIPILGVVGGIGSGKTSLADEVGRRMRSRRLDGDTTGHQVLRQPDVKRQLRDLFGDDVFDASGEVIRPAVAARVFGSGRAETEARRKLESIVHPRIRELLQQELDRLRRRGDVELIILDAPVLLESGWASLCDAIVFVDAPREQRLARVLGRGWTAAEFDRREASQLSVEEKRCRADFVVNNSGDLAAAGEQLAAWLISRFSLHAPAEPGTIRSHQV